MLTALAHALIPLLAGPLPHPALIDPTGALRFEPPVDTQLVRRLEVTRATRGAELSVWMNGEPVPEAYLPVITMDTTETLSVEVADRFLAGEGGRPSQLLRTHRAVGRRSSGTLEMGPETIDVGDSSRSPLAGTSVLWTWEGDAVGQGRAEAVAVDPETLEPLTTDLPSGLLEDLDLRGLLPSDVDGPLEVGARWSADSGALGAIVHPLGELGFEPHEGEPPAFDMSHEWTGELDCELAEDGADRAVVRFRGEVLCETWNATDLSLVPVTDGDATDHERLDLTLEGRLVWDKTRGLATEFELEGSYASEVETTKDDGQPGPAYQSRFETEGDLRVTLELVLD